MQGYTVFVVCCTVIVLLVGVALLAYLTFLGDMLRNQRQQLAVSEKTCGLYKQLWEERRAADERRAKATRAEVYSAIDSERYFQEELKRHGVYSSEKQSLTKWLTLISTYLDKAGEACARPAIDRRPTLDQIRKVAALAVCAMEEHGAPMCTQQVK